MQKKVAIRLARPKVVLNKKTHKPEPPTFDSERLADDLQAALEPMLQERFGEDVELVVTTAAMGSIELSGIGSKDELAALKEEVGELMTAAIEGLEMSNYAIQPAK